MSEDSDIQYLLRRVEECFGSAVTGARHFDELRLSVYSRTGILLSATTLKRLWGYLNEPVKPRLHTLDVLSRYAGWKGWTEFCLSHKEQVIESGPLGNSAIDVRHDLKPGDTVLLTWAPGRVCRIRYLGSERFAVTEAVATRLQKGDTFRATHIINDAPLYLNHLTRDDTDMGTYVCGSKTGVRFIVNPTAEE